MTKEERAAEKAISGSFNQMQGTAPFASHTDTILAMATFLGNAGFALVSADRLKHLESLERDHLRGEQ